MMMMMIIISLSVTRLKVVKRHGQKITKNECSLTLQTRLAYRVGDRGRNSYCLLSTDLTSGYSWFAACMSKWRYNDEHGGTMQERRS